MTFFDLHVHSAPDVTARHADDQTTVDLYRDAGHGGCVLKGHYAATTGRAAAAARRSGLEVFGGVALNGHVGGVNPVAVTAELMQGARVVWMPTADAHTQRTARLPCLGDARPDVGRHSYALPPVDPSSGAAAERVLAAIAEFDAVLATGHVSTEEVAWLLPAARRAGVRRVLLTHPGYTVPAMSIAEARELSDDGALVEVTAYQLLHQQGCDPAALAAFVRGVGLERVVLSSDAGQPDSPSPPEALELLVDVLAGEGLDRSALLAAAGERPWRLVAPVSA